MASASPPSRASIVMAFLAVYIIWGSTYLAIRTAVLGMPPFLMAGARWVLAGIALYIWRRAAGDARPTFLHWRSALVIGGLLILGGNGILSWAEQFVPSGLAALIVAAVPVWVALLVWGQSRIPPTARIGAGILLGVAGVALLVGPEAARGGQLAGVLAILGASVSWATGSLYSRRAPLPKSVLLGAAMEMVCGGLLLTLVGLAKGETRGLDLAAVPAAAWWSVGYLALFGSCVGYTAYVWLLQVSRPELVATYAFVNPIVAVALGVAILHETLTTWTLLAAGLIVLAVAIVVTAPPRPLRPPARPAEQT